MGKKMVKFIFINYKLTVLVPKSYINAKINFICNQNE